MECVYTTVDPTAKVFMRPELESRVATFVDDLALDVRQAARYASERYCTLFALDKMLSAGAVQNALESGLHRCLQDDAINYAAVLHVAKLVGITLVIRCGSPGSPCIVFPCRDDANDATSPGTSPAILIVRETVYSASDGDGDGGGDVHFRFALEAREAGLGCGAAYPASIGHSLDHVRSHLAGCDEVHRMYRDLRRPLPRNSVVELMPVVLALALVTAGGGDIVPCASGGVTKETATYHAALARRMGGKAGLVVALEAAFG
jgi:hypothetical protein